MLCVIMASVIMDWHNVVCRDKFHRNAVIMLVVVTLCVVIVCVKC
jgi:hypothetical protein